MAWHDSLYSLHSGSRSKTSFLRKVLFYEKCSESFIFVQNSFKPLCSLIAKSFSNGLGRAEAMLWLKALLTMPNWLSFLTSQGKMAVDPICALTVEAFLVRKTHSEAAMVSCPKVIWLLTFCFSWMAWLGDHSWPRRWREWWWCSLWWCLCLTCSRIPSENRQEFFNFMLLWHFDKCRILYCQVTEFTWRLFVQLFTP